MRKNDDYILVLKDKLKTVDDKELVSLVNRLIKERYELEEADRTDALTGLNNRRILSVIDDFSGIMMIDIDDFKFVNDTFGHDAGDLAIQKVAEVLKTHVRNHDHICRMGGDEFAVIFVDCPKDVIIKRAEEIKKAIEEEISIFDISLTASIGVAINYYDDNFDKLLKKSDLALYEAKDHGKDQVREFKPYYVIDYMNKASVLKR